MLAAEDIAHQNGLTMKRLLLSVNLNTAGGIYALEVGGCAGTGVQPISSFSCPYPARPMSA